MPTDLPKALFQTGSPEADMRPFLGFAACVLVVVTVLIGIDHPYLALVAAWSAIVVEVILGLWRKVRLKVSLGFILTLYGPLVILVVPGLRAIF